MTRAGKKQHQKRGSSPSTWPIPRKGSKFVPKILPGAHSKDNGMPLLVLLRDVLGVGHSRKEVKYILTNRNVLIDGRVRIKDKLPVGHMDVVEIPKLNKYYRIQLHTSSKLHAKEISDSEKNFKICKVIGKRNIRQGKTQISLHDGRNIILEKDDERISKIKNQYSVKISIPEQEILDIYPLEEGARAMVTEGNHRGKIGIIKEINKRFGPKASEVLFEDEISENGEFRTALDYVFVIGEDLELDR